MERHLNYQNEKATLYLVPTPIGNLEDMTFRAVNILQKVDLVYAEDTRVSKKILSYYNISKNLISLHEHNESKRFEEILDNLNQGMNIAIISDAGMPLLSDPGFLIVQEVKKSGFNVVALPGANALLPGLLMSGIKTIPFVFVGFLDAKQKKRREELLKYQYYPQTLIFYEAIHRIKQTLEDIYNIFGDRNFVIAREISKAYEEIISGKLSEYNELEELKGELVLIVEGFSEIIDSSLSIVEQVDFFIETGLKKTEAMKKVSEMTNIPKNRIYEEYLSEKIKEEK
ncbi:MAG: 16S rRNA (cytidine(1402)-2'-O)-methyltransferase [Candidatus Izemoplasmatales bacterium]|jgi:16S rRNA (cytidine1402-2'-O)-methyltransferase|nr:16S rRNA (cytidine(1402)-2'-O)-methyltransferase [Candidatus Izemoplasmatales bacterium]